MKKTVKLKRKERFKIMVGNEKLDLGFSTMYDMKVKRSNVNFSNEYSKFLDKNLQIKKYGNKIKEICLIFMAMDPATYSFRPDKKFWRWKSGVFDMYVNVPDYETFCNATHDEAKKIIAKLYLTSIKKYLWKRKDFDAPKFYKDVKEVFKPILDLCFF